MKPFREIECWQCSGHGVVDSGYHYPDECPTCGGKGSVVEYESGVTAKYPGGPLLGGPTKTKRVMKNA